MCEFVYQPACFDQIILNSKESPLRTIMNNNIFGFFFKINKRNCQPFEFSLNKITSSQLSRVAAKIEKDKQTLDGRTRVRQQRRTIDWSNILCVATWRICGTAAPTDPRVLIFPVKCGKHCFLSPR